MSRTDRVREARAAVQQAAIGRWIARAGQRLQNKRDVAEGGVGAADSPMRNARFRARESTIAQAREMRARGDLPFAIERKMGPTLDYVPFAPSDSARKAGRSVARVVELRGAGVEPDGFATSFLVTPRLLLTNHHVFPTAGDARGTGANFLYETSDRGIERGTIFEIDPELFYFSDERLDFAIVGITPRSIDGRRLDEFVPIPLIEATPKILIGQRVNIIQHPEGGAKQYAITENRLVDLLEEGFLHYETDTLEGSSGSPAFSETWELVGLHHASIPEMRGGRVVCIDGTLWEIGRPDSDVHWIANEGIRVSSLVKRLGNVRMPDARQQALLDELVASTSDPVDDLANEMTKGGGQAAGGAAVGVGMVSGGGTMPNNNFNLTGQVTIHVYAPGGQVIATEKPKALDAPIVAVEKVIRFDRDYDARDGYAPNFLDPNDPDMTVPLPIVAAARVDELLADKKGKPIILKYHHFEVLMNEKRRLQMWSAVNVDYDEDRKSKKDRKAFGTDKWIPDPRIPERAQIFDSEFYKPAGNIDRGHIVRREDNAWGDSEEEIEFANSDTFHWTNCTPQHEAFNQSAPGKNDPTYIGMKGLWGDFENHVQKNLSGADTKACILAGPVLDNDKDPSADFGAGKIQYPLRFWKVVAVRVEEGGGQALRVFGFVLDQSDVVKKFGIEVFKPGKFKKYQVSLADITAMTGVTFDRALHDADTMTGESAPIEIHTGDEIRTRRTPPPVQPVPPQGASRKSKS